MKGLLAFIQTPFVRRNLGGGAKKLFRKVKDQSSDFDPDQNHIRRDGIYIYAPRCS